MKKETTVSISKVLKNCVFSAIDRVAKEKAFRPFHEALLTKELVAASAFERSFSTSFGQGPIEEISRILAIANGAESERQKETRVNVNKGAADEIVRILSALRDGDSRPQWKKELERVYAFKKGDFIQLRILSDLWIKIKKREIFISIKTVKPNIDQSERAKKDMLFLKAHDPSCETFLGLYYNPGGPLRKDYDWKLPSKIFNMLEDDCVLIGDEYWDFVGGKGTYKILLNIFSEVGEETRKKLEEIAKK